MRTVCDISNRVTTSRQNRESENNQENKGDVYPCFSESSLFDISTAHESEEGNETNIHTVRKDEKSNIPFPTQTDLSHKQDMEDKSNSSVRCDPSNQKKVVWFFHHYATPPSIIGLTRPYDFSKELLHHGYGCSIFTSSFLHYAGNSFTKEKSLISEYSENGVPFRFIRSPEYRGGKISRVINMISFANNLCRAAKRCSQSEKPEVIIASSPHPLTCIAGIIVAKKLRIPCVVEVRDLWPQSIFAYESLSENSILARILYFGEKWIYRKADAVIFTIEGGKDYIKERKWDTDSGGPINLNKVFHINNGVDIETFDTNAKENKLDDYDLTDEKTFKVIYTGSIRKMNKIKLLVDAAKYVQENSSENIKFIMFGDGTEKKMLEEYCITNGIQNVVFKGNVEKKYVPYILSCANLNVLHYNGKSIWKYGGSQNKIFEYMASGKPILSTIQMGYDIIEKSHSGKSLLNQDSHNIGESIIEMCKLEEDTYQSMCANAREASYDYDYKYLAEKLVDVIESVTQRCEVSTDEKSNLGRK